mgnify:CR=1 FL=1
MNKDKLKSISDFVGEHFYDIIVGGVMVSGFLYSLGYFIRAVKK